MKRRSPFWIAALLCTPPLGLIVTPPAEAQDAPAVQQEAGANAQDDAPLSDKRPRPLGDILRRMSRTAGVQIVTDSVTAKVTVPPPADPTTPENFEAQIAALAKALPQGTTWGKLMLPDRKGRFDGDAVADYARAQAKLFGKVGERTKSDEVEILGQRVTSDKAEPLINGLNLVPVYLVTSANPQSASIPTDPNQWSNLSPDEKRSVARQQAAQLANADPSMRNAIAQQYFMIFNQLLGQLSQADRQSLMSGMSGPGQAVRVFVREDGAVAKPGQTVIVTPATGP